MDQVSSDEATASAKEDRLRGILGSMERVIVAFSGGVDSSYLAWVAADVLGNRVRAITATSPSVAESQLAQARSVAELIGISHEVIHTDEVSDPRYLANDRDRCYWCKTELYSRLETIAGRSAGAVVIDGTNQDDLGDVRPGRRAASELGVRSPLVEAGIRKAELRLLSRRGSLPTWNQPASPCLSSRVPFGISIDAGKLLVIDRAEEAVRALGYREFRVRHLGERARIEVSRVELEQARLEADALVAAVCAAGFRSAVLDDEPFRSGRLNG